MCSAMKHQVLSVARAGELLNLPLIMQRVAEHSSRPRYTFMVLDLIARIAKENGHAGPYVHDGDAFVPIREWLCLAIAPTASHHHRRVAMIEQVRASLETEGQLPENPEEANEAISGFVRERVRSSGMTAVSRAVSELVQAGLITRYYQGYRIDHDNRGAQRLAVYVVSEPVRRVLMTGRGAIMQDQASLDL